ncbi:MAG: hypothetical protein ACK4NF_03650, partial [Planctomycetota bacterium]
NYLKAKIELSKLNRDDKLKLIFSEIKTAQMVRKSLIKDGFKTTEILSNRDNSFSFFVSAEKIG